MSKLLGKCSYPQPGGIMAHMTYLDMRARLFRQLFLLGIRPTNKFTKSWYEHCFEFDMKIVKTLYDVMADNGMVLTGPFEWEFNVQRFL